MSPSITRLKSIGIWLQVLVPPNFSHTLGGGVPSLVTTPRQAVLRNRVNFGPTARCIENAKGSWNESDGATPLVQDYFGSVDSVLRSPNEKDAQLIKGDGDKWFDDRIGFSMSCGVQKAITTGLASSSHLMTLKKVLLQGLSGLRRLLIGALAHQSRCTASCQIVVQVRCTCGDLVRTGCPYAARFWRGKDDTLQRTTVLQSSSAPKVAKLQE